MPSAAAKPSNGLAAEPQEGIVSQCLAVADKKVRNLEKRRSKLQQLRDDEKGGKELNEEQRDAISRMDQVELMLEVSKDIQKQYKQLADQFEKVARRNVRVEKAAKRDADLALLAKVIRVQSVMDGVTADSREDFMSGSNQACKLSETELNQLDALYNLTRPQRPGETEESYTQAVAKGSDHLLLLVERSTKEVVGTTTTYEQLAAIVDQIEASGYLSLAKDDSAAEVEAPATEADYSPIAEVQQTDSAPAAAVVAAEDPVAVADAAPCAVADSPPAAASGKAPTIGFLHASTVQTRGGEQVPAAAAALTSSQDVPAVTSEHAAGVESTPPSGAPAAAGEPSAWASVAPAADGSRPPRSRNNNSGGRGGGGPRGGRGARGAGRGGGAGGARDFHRGDGGGEGGFYRGNQERRGGAGGTFNQRGRGAPRGGRGGNAGPRRGGGASAASASGGRPSNSSGGDFQGSL